MRLVNVISLKSFLLPKGKLWLTIEYRRKKWYPSSFPTFVSAHKEIKGLQLCFPLTLKIWKRCISKNFQKIEMWYSLSLNMLSLSVFFARTFLNLASYKKTKTNQNLYNQWLNKWASLDVSGRACHRITEWVGRNP